MIERQPGMLILPDFLIQRPGEPPKANWGIRIAGRTIQAVGSHQELLLAFPQDDRWRTPGQTLSPGFVDAHTHLSYMIVHALAGADPDRHGFLDPSWWRRAGNALTAQTLVPGLESACVNALRTGITTVNELVAVPSHWPGILEQAREIVARRGLRAVIAGLAPPGSDAAQLWETLQAVRAFLEGLSREAPPSDQPGAWVQGAVGLPLGALAHLSDPSALLQEVQALARQFHTFVHACATPGGAAPGAQFLAQLPWGGARTLLAHAGSLLPALGERLDGGWLYAPLSDDRFQVGEDLAALLGRGLPVGLGSDGVSVDFFDVLRAAFFLHNAGHPAHPITPAQLWRLATEGNARLLGLDNVGRLEPGWQADLLLIDTNPPTPLTVENLYAQLLRYGSRHRVQAVLAGGRMLVCEGVVLNVDLAGVRDRAHRAAQRLAEQVIGRSNEQMTG